MSEDMIWAKKEGKWGVLNNKGVEITSFEYDGEAGYEKGYAKVMKKDKWGLIDKTGKVVLPLVHINLSTVYKNIILAVTPNGTNTYSVK